MTKQGMLLKDGISLRYLSLYKSNTADLSAYKIPVGGSLGAYISFEFKGHPYSKGRWYFARLFLEKILTIKLYKEYWPNIMISSAHIAIGSEIHLRNLLFDKLMARKAGLYFSSDGDLELIYFQPKNRVMEIAVYDRKAKVVNRNIAKRPNESTRAEVRLGKMNMSFEHFINEHGYLNKFDYLKSYDFQQIIESGVFCRYATMAIQAMGLTPFMRKHSKYERAKYRKALKPYLIPVIELESIQTLWLKQTKKMAVMNPFNNIPSRRMKHYKAKLKKLYL
ncbi:MAG: hypothetical protein JKY81_09640 [Colwellia sp.]|nr:hypothetical protein [Colwellia sp.]